MIEPIPAILDNVLGKDYERQDCSLARALEVVGERWTLLIVRDAFYGVRRFNEFQAHLDIPKAVLSERLGWLTENGVLRRQPDPNHAGRHLYELTPAGRDLWPALHALLVWGSRHRSPNSRVFKHATCGTLLNDAGYCTKCDLTPGPQDILTEPRRGRVAVRDDPVAIALRGPHRLLEPLEQR
jgi:DNA-binding HxlR family transcriptional regulator